MIAHGLWAPPAHSPNLPSLCHHHSLEHFSHISATFPTISSSVLTLSLGVIIHLRVSSRDIIYQPHSNSLWASWPRRYSLGFKGTDNRRSSTSSGSERRKDCWHAITREATSKHLSSLVSRRETSVEITLKPSSVKRYLLFLYQARKQVIVRTSIKALSSTRKILQDKISTRQQTTAPVSSWESPNQQMLWISLSRPSAVSSTASISTYGGERHSLWSACATLQWRILSKSKNVPKKIKFNNEEGPRHANHHLLQENKARKMIVWPETKMKTKKGNNK